MSVPTVYTAIALQAYMLNQTGNLGTVLGLTANDFVDAVVDTLISYDVTSLSNATDIAKLRALAKVEAWKVTVAKAAGYMKFTADGGSFEAQQLYSQALASLEYAETMAAGYAGAIAGYTVTIGRMSYVDDPYPLPDDDDE